MPDSIGDLFGSDEPLLPKLDLSSGRGVKPRAGPKYPALSDAEAAPVGSGLLHATVSGLGYAGSTLDKLFGARAIRGLAAGKPHELLSAIPGSDTVGLTKPEDAVSMDDLLSKHYHVFKPNDPTKWEFRDFAIPALEMAADPGSYINPFGAATRAGKLAAGLGHTQGMTRKALTQGFTHSESLLKAAGHSADEIGHMVRSTSGHLLPESLELAAKAQHIPLGVGTPLRGSLGLGLPFRAAADAFGTGTLSQALAGGQDALVSQIKRAPGVPALRALFDTAAGRSSHVGVQEANALAGDPAREAIESSTRGLEFELRTRMDDLMKSHQGIPGAENEALRLIRARMEDASPHYTDPHLWSRDFDRRFNTVTGPGRTLATGVQDADAVRRHILANWNEYGDIGHAARDFGADALHGAENHGLLDVDVNDLYAHYGARRYIAAAPGYGGKDAAKQFPTIHGSNMRRKPALRDIPGGSEQLNEWAITPGLSGPGRTMSRAQVADQVYQDMERHIYSMFPAPGPMPMVPHLAAQLAEQLKSAKGKAAVVADWLGGVPDVHSQQGIPYFNPDVVGDLSMRGKRAARSTGSAAAVVRGGVDMSRPAAEFAAANEKHVLLGDFFAAKGPAGLTTGTRTPALDAAEEAALGAAGFAGPMHLRTVASNPAIAQTWEAAALTALQASHPNLVSKALTDEHFGAGIRAYERLAAHGFGPVEDAIRGKTNWHAELNQRALSEHDAAALTKYLNGWITPSEMEGPLGFMGQAQAVFKNLVYPLWPASHVRNATSALWNNAIHGTGIEDYADAVRLMTHGHVADPARYAITHGMTPQEAGAFLKRQAYADAKVGSGINQFTENVGAGGLNDPALAGSLWGGRRITPSAPGVHEPLTDVLARNGWKKSLNPLGQSGIGGAVEDTFAPLIAGRRVGTGIEDFVRLANYLGNMRGGMNSAKAGALTRAIHFDYTDLTPFERNVMKNVIPFYTFMRKNLPFQAHMALAQPNKVAPLLHLTGQTDPNREWKPDHLASGAAVPWGQEVDGTRRFLSKFGLPVEEAAERFKFRNVTTPWGTQAALPSLSGTGMAFLSTANPYATGLAEHLTGKQFSTGRDLKDLYSKGLAGGYGLIPTEYAQPLTQAVAHSPLARLFSSTDQLAQVVQGRKGLGAAALNLGTGLKVTDVDMERQRAAAQRREIERQFDADPAMARFLNFYPKTAPDGGPLPLTPEQVTRLRMFTKMKADAKAFHEARQAQLHPGL